MLAMHSWKNIDIVSIISHNIHKQPPSYTHLSVVLNLCGPVTQYGEKHLPITWTNIKLTSREMLMILVGNICSDNAHSHYTDVIMDAMASQITSLTIVYSIDYSGADQWKHQSSVSLAFVWRIHRWPVNSPHKGPVTRKILPVDDVIMYCCISQTAMS